ncbi:glycosyltransferase [Lacinutrix neustonica]|uniref:Glycosyltransferase n=1 Tax=Lacinutrix neustonica TaxID=2980107 RepID=A0A9E8MVE6_9FLAO|nr:glycosyltransferase [Lacinutrix neustonica]WAC01332.1 glycosyltransferase [Lacinutrix neustonica]
MLSLSIIIISFCYVILILSLTYGFNKVKAFKPKDNQQKTTFTVVIPFRNEAENLEVLINSMTSLHYDKAKYEVILVDDASEDDSVAIITQLLSKEPFNKLESSFSIVKNDRATNAPKKDAITSAVAIANHDWIVTTDADCILPKYWLATFDAYIQEHQPKMMVAPVTYHTTDSFLKRFQLLDFLSLMGATIGGFGIHHPFLCNGANLAYRKSLFQEVNGFLGNSNIASGDDIFLLEKALKTDKKSVHYIKAHTATVLTKAQPNWKSLVSQRKRWAAKTSNYHSAFGKLTGVLVLLMNATVIVSCILALCTALHWFVFLVVFFLKLVSDFLLLYKTSVFFNQTRYLRSFLAAAVIYPFFSVYIAFNSLFTSYNWKERRFKK